MHALQSSSSFSQVYIATFNTPPQCIVGSGDRTTTCLPLNIMRSYHYMSSKDSSSLVLVARSFLPSSYRPFVWGVSFLLDLNKLWILFLFFFTLLVIFSKDASSYWGKITWGHVKLAYLRSSQLYNSKIFFTSSHVFKCSWITNASFIASPFSCCSLSLWKLGYTFLLVISSSSSLRASHSSLWSYPNTI